MLRGQNLQSDEAMHQFHHHPPFPTAKIIVQVKIKVEQLRCRIIKKDEGNTNLIRSLLSTKATTIKEKNNRVEVNQLSVTISTHKLFQLSVSLDLEEHLIPILPHPINNFKRKHQISIFIQTHKSKQKQNIIRVTLTIKPQFNKKNLLKKRPTLIRNHNIINTARLSQTHQCAKLKIYDTQVTWSNRKAKP